MLEVIQDAYYKQQQKSYVGRYWAVFLFKIVNVGSEGS